MDNLGNGDPGGSRGRSINDGRRGIGGSHKIRRSRSECQGTLNSNLSKKSRMFHEPIHQQSTVNNEFSSLNNDVFEHEMIRTRNNNMSQNSFTSTQLPPITVFGVGISDLSKKVSLLLPNKNDIKYKLTQFGIKIFVNNATDYKKLRDCLLKSDVRCYTHRLKDEQTRKFVMYGLHDMDTDTLKDIFVQNDIYPSDIKKMKMKQQRYDDQMLYILYFQNNDKMKLEKLRTIKHINQVIVKFERYFRKKAGPILCANCLNYGHG